MKGGTSVGVPLETANARAVEGSPRQRKTAETGEATVLGEAWGFVVVTEGARPEG